MKQYKEAISRLSAAVNPEEYITAQGHCLSFATEADAHDLAFSRNSSESERLDSLQILYWLTNPNEKVSRFQKLLEEKEDENRQILEGLLFRAITEKSVRESKPEKIESYLEATKKEFAKSLYRP